jgi:riboflavin synthase
MFNPDLNAGQGIMFTGIITDKGTVRKIENKGLLRIDIQTSYPTSEIVLGSSIACDGVCLSVVALQGHYFTVEVSMETQKCTNISTWKAGTVINLERSLKVGDEMGGHFVSGHVDAVATIKDRVTDAGSLQLFVGIPPSLGGFIAAKGSITINGVSLTVNHVSEGVFQVNLIPITQQKTNLGLLRIGSLVNIEIDMLARYLAAYLKEHGR